MEKAKPRRRWVWIVFSIIGACFLIGLLGFAWLFYFRPPPSTAGGPIYTQAMQITLTNGKIGGPSGGDGWFVVPPNQNVTLQSMDTGNHPCIISGSNGTVSVQLSGGRPSSQFQLKPGSYQLSCDSNPRRMMIVDTQ